MFAVGIDELDMNEGLQYFGLRLSQVQVVAGVEVEQSVELLPCERSVWEGANPEILEIYDRNNFSKLLCPPENTTFDIAGSTVNSEFRYIKISAVNCTQGTCASASEIDNYLINTPNFNLRLYFVNGLLNPSKAQEVTYYLEDRNYVPFNTLYGGSSNIYMSRYSFATDESIMPYESTHEL
jgi:hypothetical protein